MAPSIMIFKSEISLLQQFKIRQSAEEWCIPVHDMAFVHKLQALKAQ